MKRKEKLMKLVKEWIEEGSAKWVEGYDDKYCVTRNGVVVSLKTKRILRQVKRSKSGYLSVSLSKKGVVKSFYVHRLVAMAFIENPMNKETVNHIDENINSNNFDNLEWCTMLENLNHGTRILRSSRAKKKKVKQLDIEGNLVRFWDSATDAHKEAGFSFSSISACCRGKQLTHRGYKWEFVNKTA